MVKRLFTDDFARITTGWRKKRLLLFAHGGLNDEKTAVQRVARYRDRLLAEHVYPLAFIWHTDFWTALTNILQDAIRRRRPEGIPDFTKNFMLDRLDDALEPLARALGGKTLWDEMKENAKWFTTTRQGGGRVVLKHLANLCKGDSGVEIHVVGHSAGSILLGPFVEMLTSPRTAGAGRARRSTGYGLSVKSCTLWAPACTVSLFKNNYAPAIDNGRIERFGLFTLTDNVERAGQVGEVYHNSLLYLVSNALQAQPHVPGALQTLFSSRNGPHRASPRCR